MHGEFFGVSSGSSEPVYARAAVLSEDGARPTLSGDLLVEAYRRFKRGDDETDLILVASDAALALLVSLPPGLTLAGVIAEQDSPPKERNTSRIPIISGLAGARQQISDGDLVILDPEQGRILVEPDAEEFARLQADRNRRPRVHIDSLHVPARTQAGREVAVWASIQSEADLTNAIQFGADGIFVGTDSPYLKLDASRDEDEPSEWSIESNASDTDLLAKAQREILFATADRIGGGDIAIVADISQIDPALLFEAAARCSLRWAVPSDILTVSPSDFRIEIEHMLADCLRDDSASQKRPAQSMPVLAAYVETGSPAESDLSTFQEVIVPASAVRALTIADTFDLPPLRIIIDDDLDVLPAAIALGAIGVIVLPAHIDETKDFIRAQEY